MNEKPIKLNLGSGAQPLAGYINLDAKDGFDVAYVGPIAINWPGGESLDIRHGVEEIRASHVLEHFPHGQTQAILNRWAKLLKPGGILKIAVPDFQKIARVYMDFRDGKTELTDGNLEGYLLGGQTDEYDYHKSLFDEPGLRMVMTAAGLVDIQPWTSEIADCASLPISLNLMGRKPDKTTEDTESTEKKEDSQAVPFGGRELGLDEMQRILDKRGQPERVDCKARTVVPDRVPLKIAAVMSVPRLTHTNNAASMFYTIEKLKIPCRPGQGVFWHHVLTRQIEDRIREGFEYLLAVDFDSWFLPGHVLRLAELLVTHPEADAICAVQCQREHELPIMAIHDESGLPVQRMPRSWFTQPLTRLHIGHFGLTLFRAGCFARLARPWFRDEPDPNGSWRDGRKDADVAFWGNFERSGCRLFMANEVNIGHLQEVCTFPGPIEENWRPSHTYLRDLNAGQIPPHCDPAWRIPNKDPLAKE